MKIVKQALLYLPILLGLSIIISIPVGMIFTEPQYGGGGDILGSIGNAFDYFTNGTKLSYMFLMWPLGLLLEMPLLISVLFPIAIIITKVKYGTIDSAQIISTVLGFSVLLTFVFLKKKNLLRWYFKKDKYLPNFVVDFSICAWVVTASFFLAQYFAHYVLFYIGDYFRPSCGGFFCFPDELQEYIIGFPFLYIFLSAVLFGIFSRNKEWTHSLWFALPAFLFTMIGGPVLFFWAVILFASGLILTTLFQKLFRRNPVSIAQ